MNEFTSHNRIAQVTHSFVFLEGNESIRHVINDQGAPVTKQGNQQSYVCKYPEE